MVGGFALGGWRELAADEPEPPGTFPFVHPATGKRYVHESQIPNGKVRPDSDLTTLRLRLLAGGWLPIPVTSPDYRHPKVKSPGKQPFFTGWNLVSAKTITEAMVRSWEAIRDHPNTGLICGHPLAGLDNDVLDPGLNGQINGLAAAHLGDTPLCRIGLAPKLLGCYRYAAPVPKVTTPDLFLPDGSKAKVEVMGAGQQVVAFGIHPDTRQPYRWLDRSPLDFRVHDLPVVTEAAVRAFLAAAEVAIRAAGGRTKKEIEAATNPASSPQPPPPLRPNGAGNGASFFRQVNAAALADLGRWVPKLFPKAKRQQGTGAYRVTSADLGRDYQEDLSIHPDGVRDFGPEKGMSAVDVLVEFGGAPDAKAAAHRLCELLARDRTEFGWVPPKQPNGNGATPGPEDTTSPGAEQPEPEPEEPPPAAGEDDYGASRELLVTEGAVSDAFAEQFRDLLRYCHHTGKWLRWSGTRWKREETHLAYRWAHELACKIAADSGNFKAQLAAGKASFAGGVERLAQSDRQFAVTSDMWDRDPWLLGTPGGTVDLHTGTIRPACQSDYITKSTAVAPADTPDCPLWRAFLNEATGGDTGLIRFLQQWCGYSLTGSIQEHALLFAHGPGGNGKGVWLNTVSNIMADYCRTAAMDTFIASKNDRHPTDLAALKGARMVCASETEEGRAWSEVRIKQLTGGDRIAARFMRQDFFEYSPEFKLTVIGNHMPELHNVDDAARRRINMAPFTHKPPVVDKNLEEKLRAEWPGILRWMIDGCLDWQANGLIRPAVVTASTADYFSDQDFLAQWIEECCERTDEDGVPAKDTTASLIASWRNFAKSRGEEPGGSKGFSMALRSRGFTRIKNEHGIRGRGFLGIKVRVLHFEPP